MPLRNPRVVSATARANCWRYRLGAITILPLPGGTSIWSRATLNRRLARGPARKYCRHWLPAKTRVERQGMRTIHRVVLLTALATSTFGLTACSGGFDPDKLDIFGLNEKKKLPGERKDVFPGGV